MFAMPSACAAFGCKFPSQGTVISFMVNTDPKTCKPRAERCLPLAAAPIGARVMLPEDLASPITKGSSHNSKCARQLHHGRQPIGSSCSLPTPSRSPIQRRHLQRSPYPAANTSSATHPPGSWCMSHFSTLTTSFRHKSSGSLSIRRRMADHQQPRDHNQRQHMHAVPYLQRRPNYSNVHCHLQKEDVQRQLHKRLTHHRIELR